MSITKYFTNGKSHEPLIVQRWQKLGLKVRDCKFVRERDGLAFRPAILKVRLAGATPSGVNSSHEIVLWNSELNDWLLRNGTRAEDPQNEGERFGYMMRQRFDLIEQQFGDGFFNSVLIHLLRSDEELKGSCEQFLAAVSVPEPYAGEPEIQCRERIESVLATCGAELVEGLTYIEQAAHRIFADALNYFIDERFNITNSRILGL